MSAGEEPEGPAIEPPQRGRSAKESGAPPPGSGAGGRPADDEAREDDGPDPVAPGEDFDDDGLREATDRVFGGTPFSLIFAPNSNVNPGTVHGDQRVDTGGGTPGDATGRPVEVHDGPIPAAEILHAKSGFAEPRCFSAGLAELDSGVLFLAGEPGTGRRTTALNLLSRHSDNSMSLRAVDNDVNLGTWRPKPREARGYLLDGLLPGYPLKPGVIGHLRRLLSEAGTRMVIVLPAEPELLRRLERDLHVTPVRCEPPPPREVFDARLEVAVPDPGERVSLLGSLGAELLDDLLADDLMPSQVAELVTVLAAAGRETGGVDPAAVRERLSFLARDEVPDLLATLRDKPDGLAFLLAACVFEGMDHRIVREEADRLLRIADGRLDAVLPPAGEHGCGNGGATQAGRQSPEPRPNPRFVFGRDLEELLRMVRADCPHREVRAAAGFTYVEEPVRFTRHGQREAVLRHVWRQYGQLSELLTDWLEKIGSGRELHRRAGRIMGMAAGWGGGRRALHHIRPLAQSERLASRTVAAYALGSAAEDPMLAGEVKYRLEQWSYAVSRELRLTVAHTCGTDFGTSRPDRAMLLLRRLFRGRHDERERAVETAVRKAVVGLFVSGSQSTVFRRLAEWSDGQGTDAELALGTLPQLLPHAAWFQEQLVFEGEFATAITDLVRRALNDEELSERTRGALRHWCRLAAWDERHRTALELLLTTLGARLDPGVLGLLVSIERMTEPDAAGRELARELLERWRTGEHPADGPHSATDPYGRQT